MGELSCRTARLWLQAPRDLPPEDAQLLNEHLFDCSACYQHRKAYKQTDRLIHAAMEMTTQVESVRPHVRAQIVEMQRRRAGESLLARLVPRPAWIVVSAAVTGALIALVSAHLSPSVGLAPQVASSGWRLVRADIGYPVTIDPTRSNHLLAGAGGQVYESWNGGNAWHRLAPLPPHLVVRDLAIDQSQSNRYLVATKHSVFVSADAGRHWRATVSSLRGAFNMFLMQDPRASATFYVGPSILWKSPDHGDTWHQAGNGAIFAPDGIQALTVASDGTLITGIWGGGVAMSRDGGRSWQRRAHGLRRNVLNVTAAQDGALWAATDRGAFFSTDAGRHWRRTHLPARFLNTSVIDSGKYLLAGGNGALYRSTDGGKHWHLSMDGLPLDPYIRGLLADPHHPGRVYASLNTDGVFRSDDAGSHWHGIDMGLPMAATGSAGARVLFERSGGLWITDSDGTDPGNLTVDRDVKTASLAPDGAAIAYIGASSSGWSVRILAAGGSTARTILSGSSEVPRVLAWSPNSSLLAVIQPSLVSVSNLSHALRHWAIPPGERLVGWSGEGRSLLFWDGGRVIARTWTTGQIAGDMGRDYPSVPVPSVNGKRIALVSKGQVRIGTWHDGLRAVARIGPACGVRAWSDDSTRLLLTCGSHIEERSATGVLVAQSTLSSTASWVPGSHTSVLFFRHDALWRWTPGLSARLIVHHARAVAP
jgi:photosystem II stability/assembly factor-like uncharacterized protein